MDKKAKPRAPRSAHEILGIPEPVPPARDGTTLIAEERTRQKAEEGYSASHDDDHKSGELATAAACYAAASTGERIYRRKDYAAAVHFSDPWPWEQRDDARPYNGNVLRDPTPEEALRLLVKAGALIAAEIDRLERDRVRRRERLRVLNRCQSDRDGDCTWEDCPQNRDGEPTKSGRHCPLDRSAEEEY